MVFQTSHSSSSSTVVVIVVVAMLLLLLVMTTTIVVVVVLDIPTSHWSSCRSTRPLFQTLQNWIVVVHVVCVVVVLGTVVICHVTN